VTDEDELPSLWKVMLADQLSALQIYGTPRVTELAQHVQAAYRNLLQGLAAWQDDGTDNSTMELDQLGDQFDLALHELVEAVRKDLGIPDGTSSGPAAGHSSQGKQS